MDKRSFLKTTAILGATAVVLPGTLLKTTGAPTGGTPKGPFKLPALPYAYDAFPDVIDKQTMEIHHNAHHQAYIDKLNVAVEGKPMEKQSIEAIIKTKNLSDVLRNNGGGHWNHTFFWETLTPEKVTLIGGLNDAIKKKWATIDMMKAEMTKAALGQFGSGWAWLCVDSQKQLFITSTPNQDNPLMDLPTVQKGMPILGIDVWEHAYYLKYHEKRKDYVNNIWNIINWPKIELRYQAAVASTMKK